MLRFLLAALAIVFVAGCYRVDPVQPIPDDDDSAAAADDDDDDTTPPPDDDDVTDPPVDDDDVTDPPVDDDDVTDPPVDDDDATEPPPEPVRWIVMGDTGEGNDDQYAVSGVAETVCAAQGCDFALLMGDNFYDIGVDSVDDPQWDEKFEDPYANLDLLFYPTLGNHDGGFEGAGLETWKGDIQVDYTDFSDKWEMPARFYKHSHGPVDFYSLDTSSIFFDGGFLCPECDTYAAAQVSWLQSEWGGGSTGDWRIAYGHHPYISNGPHGNAGLYEGIPFIPYLSGNEIKDFLEGQVCGNVDLYLCGHDHSRQWMVDTCSGTNLMISGAGAKTSDLEGSNPTYFEDVDNEGFIWFEALGNTLTVQFWNRTGVMDYEGTITK